ncbi:MAG: SBBP repeat-containing protein [Betaproteobacteria bacterium]
MFGRILGASLLALVCLVRSCDAGATATATATVSDPDRTAEILDRSGRLPLAFEENRGQHDSRARFVAHGGAYRAFFTDQGVDLVLGRSAAKRASVVRMRLAFPQAGAIPSGHDPLPGRTHYLIESDAARHVRDVVNYAGVDYLSPEAGVDLRFYGSRDELEFDVIVAPGVDPRKVRLAMQGAQALRLSHEGSLIVRTASGDMSFRKPVAYQEIDGARRFVDASYQLARNDQVGFRVGQFDPAYPLVIDPVLSASTNLWGTVGGVALDAAKNIYVTGTIWTTDLPVAGGYQTQLAGSYDAYVIKLNPTGTGVIYTTYLGARRATSGGVGIGVDAAGSAYLTGTTTSTSFPITSGAYRSSGSTFVTKLNAAGNALAYSTYVTAPVASLAVDGAGNVYMTGTATALVTTAGAFQPTKAGTSAPYVAKLAPTGTAMMYATYLGGSANDEGKGIAIDGSGNAYVVGTARSVNFPLQNPFRAGLGGSSDAFVAKLNASGSALVYATYLGGSADERGLGIAVDATGQAYVTGWTTSFDFPVTPGVFQRTRGSRDSGFSIAFVAKLNSAGNALSYASYLGGDWCLTTGVFSCFAFLGPDEGIDVGTSIAVDAAGFAYIGGYTSSVDLRQVDPLAPIRLDGDQMHMPLVARVTPNGSELVYASALGPNAQDAKVTQIIADGTGGAVAIGNVSGLFFPLTGSPVLGSGTGFVFKLGLGAYPTTIKSSANPAGPAQSIALTASVLNPAPGAVVTFKDGTTTLGAVGAAGGTATLNVTLPAGVHRVTATNSIDGKVSPPYFQIVRGQ